MTLTKLPLNRLLPFAGAIPFVFGAILLVLGIDRLWLIGETTIWLGAYGAVIASFMAGVHWGQHLSLSGRFKQLLPLSSNAAALLTWFSWVWLSFTAFLVILALVFALLALIDVALKREGVITAEYLETRLIVSMLVIISLLVALIASV